MLILKLYEETIYLLFFIYNTMTQLMLCFLLCNTFYLC